MTAARLTLKRPSFARTTPGAVTMNPGLSARGEGVILTVNCRANDDPANDGCANVDHAKVVVTIQLLSSKEIIIFCL